jgi:hypothetical protein
MSLSNSKLILLLGVSVLQVTADAQSDSLIHHLLTRIEAQQKNQDAYFIEGIFPSYISRNETFRSRKKDNTLFYNGLIVYTLQKTENQLSEKSRLLMKNIIHDAKRPFPQFKNKKGRHTYNFWRTDSLYVFPYTWWIKLLHQKSAPPDDMDDTVLSHLALKENRESAAQLHTLMQRYTNHDTANKKSIEKKYQSFKFYSTWFGKTFPVVMDVSVLCNILCFVQENDLTWTEADSASLNVILAIIHNKDMADRALLVSPYYGKTSIILYHLARLMYIGTLPELEELKPKLRELTLNEFSKSTSLLEKIILASSLLKWGYPSPEFALPPINQLEEKIERNDFPFFIGNIPSYFSSGKRKFFTKNKIGLFYHYCPAFNDALLIEYLSLKNKSIIAK